MAPKRHPKEPPNGTQREEWVPPRGIRFDYREGRPSPFLLLWRTDAGERKKQAFKSAEDRETIAKEMAAKRERHGSEIFDFDPVAWRTWLEFKRMIGEADPLRVASEWLKTREGTGSDGVLSNYTVSEAFNEYLRLRKAEEKLSDDTWRHIDKHVAKRFVGTFGAMRLHALTTSEIRKWMNGLTHPKTGLPMEPITKGHHRKDVNSFLDRCVREGWIAKNPCELVIPPSTDDAGDVVVIPVRDAFEFFKANAGSPETVRVALEAFGGVRYKTAGRLSHANLNFTERGIEMPGEFHKSGRRKFRQGHPDNLWAWLELARDEKHKAWPLTLRQYAEAKREALANAKLRPFVAKTDEERDALRDLRNVWRHSFASYLLAKSKSLPTVQYLMQHRHSATTEIYEGVATERDAALYFAITPETVKLTWDEFTKKVLP